MSKTYDYLSFDCYGTLIDWEKGILTFFNTFKDKYTFCLEDREILRHYAKFEAEEEHGEYKPYREILKGVLIKFCTILDIKLAKEDEYALAESVKVWPPFPDSNEALKKLQKHYKLVIISNIDDDLFAYSEIQLGVKFDHIFTAMQMKSYKPNLNNFHFVKKALNLNVNNWLHVAQSLYHDHRPAGELGIDSVWIKRKSLAGDQGIAPLVDIVPSRVYSSMEEFTNAQVDELN
jgi:2-haloacid dehalogenase